MRMSGSKKAQMRFKRNAKGYKASVFIICGVFCKSFADYLIVWGLMDYMTGTRNKEIGFAAATLNVTGSLESLTTIVVIFLSDAYVGRYFLLLVSLALYTYGLLVFSLSVPADVSLFFSIVALVLLTAGGGGIEGTLRKFGADQFTEIEKGRSSKRPWRICWYAGSFAGSALGTIANGFIFRHRTDEEGWIFGGFISAALMGAAFYWIAAGTLLYVKERPQRNRFKPKLHNVLMTAIVRRQADHGVDGRGIRGAWCREEGPRSAHNQDYKEGLTAESNECKEVVSRVNLSGRRTRTWSGSGSDAHANSSYGIQDTLTNDGPSVESQIINANRMSATEVGVQSLNPANQSYISVNTKDEGTDAMLCAEDNLRHEKLDRAPSPTENMTSGQSSEVREDISGLAVGNQMELEADRPSSGVPCLWTRITLFPIWTALGLFPIWTTFLMYGVASSMKETFFLEQASSMDLRIGHSFELPLTFFIAVSVLSRILVSWVCLPLLNRATGLKQGVPPTIRIGAGQILAALCCFAASLVESKRIKAVENEKFLLDGSDNPSIAMSVFWLVPQYALSGAMSSLLADGISDFFVDQVPNPLKACKVIFSESIMCLGKFLTALAIVATSKLSEVGGRRSWFGSDINSCRLHDYYKTIAFLSLVNLCFYLYFEKRYPWNMTMSEERTETANEMVLNEFNKEGAKAQQQDQRRSQSNDETTTPEMSEHGRD